MAAIATSACGGKTEGVEGAKVESTDKGGGAPAAEAKPVFPLADLGSAPQLVGDLATLKLGAALSAQPAGLLIDDPKKATRPTRYLDYAKQFEDARVSAYFNDGAINVVKVDFKRSVRAELDKAWGPATMIGREADQPVWYNPKAGLRAKYEEQAFGGKPEGNIEFARYTPNEALLGKGNVAFEKADAPILGADLATLEKAYGDIIYVQSAAEGKKAMEGAAAMAGNAEIAKLAPKSDTIRFNMPPTMYEDSLLSDTRIHLSFDDAGKVERYRFKIAYVKKDPATRDAVKKAIDEALGTATEGEEYGDKIWTYAGGFKVEEDTISGGWDIEREAPKAP